MISPTCNHSIFQIYTYVGDKEDSEEVPVEELIQKHLRWVAGYLCFLVFVLSAVTVWNKSNICFSEKFEEVCDVCQRKYTTTLLQSRKKYTIISINRKKLLDPNFKSKCKIEIPIHAISCILHWREIQTHLILINCYLIIVHFYLGKYCPMKMRFSRQGLK